MLGRDELQRMQREQFRHDEHNHKDILYLPKPDRLKHYGLHFAKYVGRLARGSSEEKSEEQTLIDAILVSLSAANMLLQDLSKAELSAEGQTDAYLDPLRALADASGRFADACEKLDHYEEGRTIALAANLDIMRWLLNAAEQRKVDVKLALKQRRADLAKRHFYLAE